MMFKNKRGDFTGIIALVGITLIMIMIAPFLLKLVVTPLTSLSTALSTTDATNVSANAVTQAKNTFTGTFDWIIVILFMFNVLLLFITAFLIDVHPAFFLVYIIGLFMLFGFAPAVLDTIDTIYSMNAFAGAGNNVIQYLPMVDFLRENFTIVLLGIAITTAIIMYGKYRLAQSGTNGGNYY